MAGASHLTQLIESFVDSTRPASQQASSLGAIASLLKNDQLSLEALVREMEMYLTTGDNILRGRGILLLSEVVSQLSSKPLRDDTVRSLINFFAERLADWRALRGAVVGCLALLRRKSSGGVVIGTDAKAVVEFYLQNLQVQALGQYDRKLCFELLECLLERYPNDVASLGDQFIYAVCEAVDKEKDPHCLLLTFHIIELLPQVFPDTCSPLTDYAQELFEIFGCYFPINFTHPNGEVIDIKREDLSAALMRAFGSTSLYEPFAIPLLLEKLSSSLPSARIDSLRYLSCCTRKYGADRMEKHGASIWSSLKDIIYTSYGSILSFCPESLEGSGFKQNEVAEEALNLLQELIVQNSILFSHLILDDDISMVFNTILTYSSYSTSSSDSSQKLHAVGRTLFSLAKASVDSCNKVFESLFPRLMDVLGLQMTNGGGDCFASCNIGSSIRLNHGAAYLCIELIGACRDLSESSRDPLSNVTNDNQRCWNLLQSFSASLTEAFSITARSNYEDAHDADMYFGVKGLQILATFPGGYLLISRSIFEKILLALVAIVTGDYDRPLLWKLALKALHNIGSYVVKRDSVKAPLYMDTVIMKLIALFSLHDDGMPFQLRLEAISYLGKSVPSYMPRIAEGFEEAIYATLSEALGKSSILEIGAQLLECYSDTVLPWLREADGFEEILLRFANNIWDQLENSMLFNVQSHQKRLLEATMKAMKLAVSSCSEEGQKIIIQKSVNILSSSTSFPMKEPSQCGGIQIAAFMDNSSKDGWIFSLFASVIIALHPQTQVPNVRTILYLFMGALLQGCVPAAQALGSVANKLNLRASRLTNSDDFTFEEAMDIICNWSMSSFADTSPLETSGGINESKKTGLLNLCSCAGSSAGLQTHAIIGLAWVGKGLLMRGHDKVRDVTMALLSFLESSDEPSIFPKKSGTSDNDMEEDLHHPVMKSAADAFQIFMGDSESCLSREFHAVIKPLYKQRFFSTMMPIFQSLLVKPDALSRLWLFRAFAHVVACTPLTVVLGDAKKVILMLLEALTMLSNDVNHKDVAYGLLLVLSGILTDKNNREAVLDNAYIIINCLLGLISCEHMMLIRETAIQCLTAISELPHTRVYPMRTKVLCAVTSALDDPKRAVRQEAVRCRQAWASIGPRSAP